MPQPTPPRKLPPLDTSGGVPADSSSRASDNGSRQRSPPVSSPAESIGVASSFPSPTVGWRHEQSLTPLQLITNLGTLDASRNAWKNPSTGDVPPGVDRESYLAGEKGAMLRLFQEVLPSQQALGALAAAVHRLQEDVSGLMEMHGTMKALQSSMHAQKDRLSEVEHRRLPALDSRVDILQREAAPEELLGVLRSLHGLHANLMSAREAEKLWSQRSLLERAFVTLKSWFVGSISQMDVALLFLSRRILLGSYSERAQGGAGKRYRAAVGAMLFVALVEASWQAQRTGVSHLPWPLNHMLKPMKPGMKVMRTLCWSALLVLSVHEVRKVCFWAVFVGSRRERGKALARASEDSDGASDSP